MKKILFVIYSLLFCLGLYADTLPQYEQEFLQYEQEMSKKHNFVSKQLFKDKMYELMVNHFRRIDPAQIKQMIVSVDAILVENVTDKAVGDNNNCQYYYSIQVKLKDGVIMEMNDETRYVDLMDRSEVIAYIKKHFDFPEIAKLTLRAVYDFSFYNHGSYTTIAKNWKYRVTIENGAFRSKNSGFSVNTLFVSPYIDGKKGIKEAPVPDNNFPSTFFHNRIYAYQTDVGNLGKIQPAQAYSAVDKNAPVKYVGVD